MNDDLEDFLSRVEEVTRQVQDIKDGKVDLEMNEIDEEEMKLKAEEMLLKSTTQKPIESKEEFNKRREEAIAKLEREKAINAAKRKKEEKDKWWTGAEFLLNKGDDNKDSDGKTEEEVKSEAAKENFKKNRLDYSKWDKWVADPDDPVTLMEKKLKEEEETKIKDEEFEKRNAEFCNQVKEDFSKRKEDTRSKEKKSADAKEEGNIYFKAKKYHEAIDSYMIALKLTPFEQAILTNIAQAYLRLKEYEDSIEFCNRALYINENNVKALSRRAAAKYALNELESALNDINRAVSIEPSNNDIKKEKEKIEKAYNIIQREEKLKHEAEINRKDGSFSELTSIDGMLKGLDMKDVEVHALTTLLSVLEDSDDNRIYFRSCGGINKLCDRIMNDINLPHTDLYFKVLATSLVENQLNACKIYESGVVAKSLEFIQSENGVKTVSLFVGVLEFLDAVALCDYLPAVKSVCADINCVKKLFRLLDEVSDDTIITAICNYINSFTKVESGLKVLVFIRKTVDIFNLFGNVLHKNLKGLTREAISTILASLSTQKNFYTPIMSSHKSLISIKELVKLIVNLKDNTNTCVSNSMAALCNLALVDEDLLLSIHNEGLIDLLISEVSTGNMNGIISSRAVSLLSRCVRNVQINNYIRCNPSFITSLLKVLKIHTDAGDFEIRDKVVLIFASILNLEDEKRKDVITNIRKNDGEKVFIKVLQQVCPEGRKHSNAAGNIVKCLISLLKGNDTEIQESCIRLMKLKVIEYVIELIKSADDGPVRKNASILLARLAKNPAALEKIRELRGMEMLLSMSNTLTK